MIDNEFGNIINNEIPRQVLYQYLVLVEGFSDSRFYMLAELIHVQ